MHDLPVHLELFDGGNTVGVDGDEGDGVRIFAEIGSGESAEPW
jgi:hypothetical protein